MNLFLEVFRKLIHRIHLWIVASSFEIETLEKPFRLRRRALLAAIYVLLVLAYPLWHEVKYWKPTNAKVPELQAESKLIPAPGSDVLTDQKLIKKSGQVLLERSYNSPLNYSGLRKFYDAQLQ